MGWTETHKARRRICTLLEARQKAEAEIVRHTNDAAVAGKRQVIELLSDYLISHRVSQSASANDTSLIGQFSRLSPESWVKMCSRMAHIGEDLDAAREAEKAAKEICRTLAPVPIATRLLADESGKRNIDRANRDLQESVNWRRELEFQRAAHIVTMQRFCEEFFRDALGSMGNVVHLEGAGEKIARAIAALDETLAQEWGKHTSDELDALGEVEACVASLRDEYSTAGRPAAH